MWVVDRIGVGYSITLCHCRVEGESGRIRRVKYWDLIADRLSKAGFSWGCVAAMGHGGRTIWIAEAHRDDGKRSLCTPMKS
jgi:hypothetical protein